MRGKAGSLVIGGALLLGCVACAPEGRGVRQVGSIGRDMTSATVLLVTEKTFFPSGGRVPGLKLPKPRGRTLSRSEAAKRYLNIVKPYNATADSLLDLLDGDADWRAEVAAWRKYAVAGDRETVELARTAWPSLVRADVKRLIESKLDRRDYTWLLATATSEDEYSRLGSGECRDGLPASRIRAGLGLPAA